MFEGRGAEGRTAGACAAGLVGLPSTENKRAAIDPGAVWAGPVEDALDSQVLVERLAAASAGAGLASLIEDLLAGMLVPAHPEVEADARSPRGLVGGCAEVATTASSGLSSGNTGADAAYGAAGAGEITALMGVAETDGVLAAIGSPTDQDLVRTAGGLGVDWGEGTGIDALASLGGQVLSELVAACHRLAAWASWCESTAAACLARTAEMNRGTAPWGPEGRSAPFVTEEECRFTTSGEIAARLGVSRTTASQVLDRGQALLQPEFAATEALFRSGLLDASKSSLVIRRLQDADIETAVIAAGSPPHRFAARSGY